MENQLTNKEKEAEEILQTAKAEALKVLEVAQVKAEKLVDYHKQGRYIDVSRIPLICQSIVQIGKDIEEIKGEIRISLDKTDKYATKDDVNFLRNLLISGLMLIIAAGVIAGFMTK